MYTYSTTYDTVVYESTFVSNISVLSSIYFRTKVLSYVVHVLYEYCIYFRRLKFCYFISYESTFESTSKYNVLSYFRKYNYNVVQRTKVLSRTFVLSYESTLYNYNNVRKYESTFESTNKCTTYESTKVLSKVQLQLALQRCTTYESTFVRK